MNIIYVVRDDYHKNFGGDRVMIEGEQKYLENSGHTVKVLTGQNLSNLSEGDIIHLTQIHQIESAHDAFEWSKRRGIPFVISPLFEENLVMWFNAVIRKPGKWQMLVRLIGKKPARKIYTSWNRRKAQRAASWRLQREIIQESSVVTNSLYERNHLSSWFRLPALTATMIHLGIDPLSGSTTTEDNDEQLGRMKPYVLEVGRIETRKNQLGLLEALYELNIPIVFLGKPGPGTFEYDYYLACRKLAERRGNVTFYDYLSPGSLARLYKHAAVHVLPSWSERPGLVTLEAIACGCRAVSTVYSPISEYLGNDIPYCDPDKPESINMAVQRALSSPFPAALQAKVLEIFTWQKSAEQLIAHYMSLV